MAGRMVCGFVLRLVLLVGSVIIILVPELDAEVVDATGDDEGSGPDGGTSTPDTGVLYTEA
jgi:hypothetical protein